MSGNEELKQLMEPVIFQRLGIYDDEVVPHSLEELMEQYQDLDVANIYYKILSEFQDELQNQIQIEQHKILNKGIKPAEYHLFENPLMTKLVKFKNQKLTPIERFYHELKIEQQLLFEEEQKIEKTTKRLRTWKSGLLAFRQKVNDEREMQVKEERENLVIQRVNKDMMRSQRIKTQVETKLEKAKNIQIAATEKRLQKARTILQRTDEKHEKIQQIFDLEEKEREIQALNQYDKMWREKDDTVQYDDKFYNEYSKANTAIQFISRISSNLERVGQNRLHNSKIESEKRENTLKKSQKTAQRQVYSPGFEKQMKFMYENSPKVLSRLEDMCEKSAQNAVEKVNKNQESVQKLLKIQNENKQKLIQKLVEQQERNQAKTAIYVEKQQQNFMSKQKNAVQIYENKTTKSRNVQQQINQMSIVLQQLRKQMEECEPRTQKYLQISEKVDWMVGEMERVAMQ